MVQWNVVKVDGMYSRPKLPVSQHSWPPHLVRFLLHSPPGLLRSLVTHRYHLYEIGNIVVHVNVQRRSQGLIDEYLDGSMRNLGSRHGHDTFADHLEAIPPSMKIGSRHNSKDGTTQSSRCVPLELGILIFSCHVLRTRVGSEENNGRSRTFGSERSFM